MDSTTLIAIDAKLQDWKTALHLSVYVVEHPDAAGLFRHRRRQSPPRLRFLERR